MDRVVRHSIQTYLKIANTIMAAVGIAILMYSAWMVVICIRDHRKHHLPWFLWACVGAGAFFCFTAALGYAAAATKKSILLHCYIFLMFLVLLLEILVLADVWLNDHWDKYIFLMFLVLLLEILVMADVCLNDDWDEDFPKDRTERFDDFVDFVDDHKHFFRCLALFILFFQATSFILAIALRARQHHGIRAFFDRHMHDATLPFLNHNVHHPPPYVVGYSHPAPVHNVMENAAPTTFNKDATSTDFNKENDSERQVWMMAANGYPPCY